MCDISPLSSFQSAWMIFYWELFVSVQRANEAWDFHVNTSEPNLVHSSQAFCYAINIISISKCAFLQIQSPDSLARATYIDWNSRNAAAVIVRRIELSWTSPLPQPDSKPEEEKVMLLISPGSFPLLIRHRLACMFSRNETVRLLLLRSRLP